MNEESKWVFNEKKWDSIEKKFYFDGDSSTSFYGRNVKRVIGICYGIPYLTMKQYERIKKIRKKECPKPEVALVEPRRKNYRGTIFWDLDHCLVHCERFKKNTVYDHLFKVKGKTLFGMVIRPYAKKVLKECHDIGLENVLYSAGSAPYVDAVMKIFDPNSKLFDHILTRKSLNIMKRNGKKIAYVKNISSHNRDLETSILVDDTVGNFAYCLSNGLSVTKFIGDKKDDIALMLILTAVKHAFSQDDVRVPIANFIYTEQIVLQSTMLGKSILLHSM